MDKTRSFLLALIGISLTSCVGYDVPHIFGDKPISLIQGGEQLGRDQLANRSLVANKVLPLKGKFTNEVLTLLGQPQQIRKSSDGASEDWLFVYYHLQPKQRIDSKQGSFVIHFYDDKVLSVTDIE